MAHRGDNPVVGLQYWENHRISHPVFAVAVRNNTPGVNPVVCRREWILFWYVKNFHAGNFQRLHVQMPQ